MNFKQIDALDINTFLLVMECQYDLKKLNAIKDLAEYLIHKNHRMEILSSQIEAEII